MNHKTTVGIDFGTTNSAVAWSRGGAPIESTTFRSILFFGAERGYSRARPMPQAGPAAIQAYLARTGPGRLVQSIKSLTSDRSFRRTQIASHYFSFEELVAEILKVLLEPVRDLLQDPATKVVAGRPVRFVGAETPEDDDFAVQRLRTAFELAGLPRVHFEFEPIAAAYFYETQLSRDEVVLIADFGGGTSDFSILRVGPGMKHVPETNRILANKGLPFAGDAFDAAIIRHLVSPLLGRGSHYLTLGKRLPVPHRLYRSLEKWHHLSFLRSRETMQLLQSLEAQAEEPDPIRALTQLIENDLGFQLHQAVQKAKSDLSQADRCSFQFSKSDLTIEREVLRTDFEGWIQPELEQIGTAVDQAVAEAGISAAGIDSVFLTGGSSLVPSVRRVFERRFGVERIRAGNEFTSVVEGLALCARRR